MKLILLALILVVVCYGMLAFAQSAIGLRPPAQDGGRAAETSGVSTTAALDVTFSGPYTHENLAVFLVHGRDFVSGTYQTLEEALERDKVRIHETGNVGSLQIENLADEDVFIQAGDIVRGGKQDRMLAIDLILEARSGRVAVDSFCVEKGRWSRRSGESVALFSASKNQAPSNEIKLAAKRGRNQAAVWSGVARAQQRLSTNLGRNVASEASASSLELTLEHGKLKESAADYAKPILAAIREKEDALGVVVAINGRLYSADVYGSRALFAKLSAKLVEAAAVEAVASLKEPRAATAATADDARAFLLAATDSAESLRHASKRTRMTLREKGGNVLFETTDVKAGALLHVNCMQSDAQAESTQGSGLR